MITYVYLDKKSQVHSIANVDGFNVSFWYSLFDKYTQEEVETYLQAEAFKQQGNLESAVAIIEPFMSGESDYKIETIEDENGERVTIETGSDNRSFLKRWYDENL